MTIELNWNGIQGPHGWNNDGSSKARAKHGDGFYHITKTRDATQYTLQFVKRDDLMKRRLIGLYDHIDDAKAAAVADAKS